ncbi:MAG: SBBP repeat-containing protein [Candidatus Cloacimonetes bacterium]|nr:SBBP repeat-containing protein [Candidatus Cloacimonadota bacterium]
MVTNKHFWICVIVSVLTFNMLSGVRNWEWAKRAGGIEVDYASAIATDSDNNAYITGYFSGTTIIGNTTLASNTGVTSYVAKMDAAGNWLWAIKNIGTIQSNCQAYDIEVDASGNVIICGYFSGFISIGNMELTSTSDSEYDIFVAKIDPNGNCLWAKHAGGNGNDYCTSLAVDGQGDVYVIGCYDENALFGAIHIQNTEYPYFFTLSTFVAKLSVAGDWLWVKAINDTEHTLGMAIAVGSDQSVYITGDCVSFLPIIPRTLGDDMRSAFIAKLDSEGNWLWAKLSGGLNKACGYAIAPDNQGNVYVSGDFTKSASFGDNSLISNGKADIFVSKLTTGGEWLWARQTGSTGWDRSYYLAVDDSANAYISGYYEIAEPDIPDSLRLRDAFVSKISPEGNWLWAESVGSTSENYCYGIAMDSANSIYMAGDFLSNADFGSLSLTSNGSSDIYVAKLSESSSIEDDTSPQLPVFALAQNYPNPFNPSTTISFSIAKAEKVSLDIYNIKGQHVNCLVDGDMAQGAYSIVWNGKDKSNNSVASGVYLYRLNTVSNSQTKKMIMLK